jgi:protoporphyrinogen oxidase
MNRKEFIKNVFGVAAFAGIAGSCKNQSNIIKGSIIGASANIGHIIRDGKTAGRSSAIIKKEVVIVGGGISGLSAAWHLQASGVTDFLLLDLEKETGGNSKSGQNAVSAFPWGAHYVPVPNNNLTAYIDFLKSCGVVKSIGENSLPEYNEAYLCFDPEERLFINGQWQDGIIPHFGVPEKDTKQISSFLNKMNEYRYAVGDDKKEAFAIPVNESSKDNSFLIFDLLTMQEWMLKNGFTSSYLHNYVNYCTRDDFGTPHNKISAWAGIHYFAARKGKATNASYSDVLTWPEGNGFLVNKLQAACLSQIKTNSLVTKITYQPGKVLIDYFDVTEHKNITIEAAHCIIAAPQFIASRLLNDKERIDVVKKDFHYSPWMVANITTKELKQKPGAPVSWDNVIYESESLGYIDATHQQLQVYKAKRNLTYYLPLCTKEPVTERKQAQNKTHTEWVKFIMDDLKKVHADIEEQTEEINVMLWGHAMIQPLPGYISGKSRATLAKSVNNNIHFAHTDIAGISIFEEAFYQGLNAAKKVIDHGIKNKG